VSIKIHSIFVFYRRQKSGIIVILGHWDELSEGLFLREVFRLFHTKCVVPSNDFNLMPDLKSSAEMQARLCSAYLLSRQSIAVI